MLHDSVSARFGGRDLTLKIARTDLPAFEAATGDSAFAVLKAIHAGAWTVRQVKSVIGFAMAAPEQLRLARGMARASLPIFGGLEPTATHVERVFATRPPAIYAPLAEAILGAALFGITAEEATFTDEPDGA